jgi:methionyl-tRNA formyltransferase
MRIVFFGTPVFALPAMDAVRGCGELLAAVTQPARRRGRGMTETPSPVWCRAKEMGVPVHSPESIRTPEFAAWLSAWGPDLAVVVAYGRILPPGVLSIPRLGCINVHASLLPLLRGAAPVQWAIAGGHEKTGVTLMRMDDGLDTGPVLARRETGILPSDTAPVLSARLAIMGGEILKDDIPRLARGELAAAPQDHQRATLAPPVRKEDGVLRWDKPARLLEARVRAFQPWPGAVTTRGGSPFLVTRALALEGRCSHPPGTVVAAGAEGIDVATGEGFLRVSALRPAGKREMTAAAYLAGHSLSPGERLGGGEA